MDQSKLVEGETDREMKELNQGMNELLDSKDEELGELLLQESERIDEFKMGNLEQLGMNDDSNRKKEREKDELNLHDISGKDGKMNGIRDDSTMSEGVKEELRNEVAETGVTDRQRDDFKEVKFSDGQRNESKENGVTDGQRDELKAVKFSDELKENGVTDGQMNKSNEIISMDELRDREYSEWRVDEYGSMNLLDDTEYVLVEEEVSTVPIDRGWAWMSVVGCFGMHILAVGGIKCFGVLFVEFEHHYDVSSTALSSIQAVSSTFMMALSPVSNALSEKFGCRRVVFLGGTLLLIGFLSSAFVPSYEWLYLTYGVIAGFGFGLSYAPCIVFVGHHFHKYRALANGLSVSGSGFGLFIFPPCMHFFIQWFGLSGALMLISAFMFHICACAMLFRPLSSYKRKYVKKLVPNSTLNDEREQLVTNENEFEMSDIKLVKNGVKCHKKVEALRSGSDLAHGSLVDITAVSLQSLPTDKRTQENNASSIFCCQKSKKSSHSEPRCQKYMALLMNPVFQIFLVSTMLTNFAYPTVFIMVPSYAEEINVDKQSGALMVSIIGISDLVGRIFFGWFSDRRLIPRKHEFMGTMGISGVLSLILPFIKTKVALFVYCGLYGFFAGAYICLIAVVLVDVLGLENLSMGFGIVGLSLAVGLLASPPIVGALRDISGSWDYSFMFAGLIAIVAALIILLEPLAQRKIQRQNKLKEENKMA